MIAQFCDDATTCKEFSLKDMVAAANGSDSKGTLGESFLDKIKKLDKSSKASNEKIRVFDKENKKISKQRKSRRTSENLKADANNFSEEKIKDVYLKFKEKKKRNFEDKIKLVKKTGGDTNKFIEMSKDSGLSLEVFK